MVDTLPELARFDTPEDYYSTALHELTHWTGAPHRLNRDKKYHTRNGRAKEELVAELGAAFLCGHLKIAGKLQHAEYIGSWLEVLRNDKRAIFQAASAAAKAADCLKAPGAADAMAESEAA